MIDQFYRIILMIKQHRSFVRSNDWFHLRHHIFTNDWVGLWRLKERMEERVRCSSSISAWDGNKFKVTSWEVESCEIAMSAVTWMCVPSWNYVIIVIKNCYNGLVAVRMLEISFEIDSRISNRKRFILRAFECDVLQIAGFFVSRDTVFGGRFPLQRGWPRQFYIDYHLFQLTI